MPRPNPEISNPGGYYSYTDTGGNTTSTYGSVTRPIYRRDWSGAVTPGYRSLSNRERAKLPTLDHTVTIETTRAMASTEREILRYTSGVSAGRTFYRTAHWDVNRARDLLSVCPLGSSDEANTRAIARLAQEVQGKSVNLAQAFAERRQTASLATNNLYRIFAAGLALKRGRLRDFNEALKISASPRGWARVERSPPSKRLANHWLEYVYGWRPLLSDIHDAAELVAQHARDDRVTHSAYASATHRTSENWTTNHGGSQRTVFDAVYDVKVKYGLHFTLDSVSRNMLSATGISNPALLAWELLPWSFVVDWFIPVGNYLEALDAFSGTTFVDGWRITYRTSSSQCRRFGTSSETWVGPYWSSFESSMMVSHTKRGLIRNKLTAYPNIPLPKFKNPIGGEPLTRFATALALARQLFR